MTSDRPERHEYEGKLAKYLAPMLTDHVGAYIEHTQAGESWNLQVMLGRIYDKHVDYKGIDYPPQRPGIVVPFFSLQLHDWPLWRSVELDLGPRFRKALALLSDACEEARDEIGWEREVQRARASRGG